MSSGLPYRAFAIEPEARNENCQGYQLGQYCLGRGEQPEHLDARYTWQRHDT